MTQTLTRTGIVEPSGDGSDPFDPVTYLRNIAAWAEAQGAQYAQGLLAARPAAGKAGRLYRATDDVSGVIYYDDGTTWQSIGGAAPTDGSAGTPSLRTLGSGATQAAAGNHTHAIGAITGAGGAASLNVGATTGTVAAGDHTHSGLTFYGYKWLSDATYTNSAVYSGNLVAVTGLPAGTYAVRAQFITDGGSSNYLYCKWDSTSATGQVMGWYSGTGATASNGTAPVVNANVSMGSGNFIVSSGRAPGATGFWIGSVVASGTATVNLHFYASDTGSITIQTGSFVQFMPL